MPDHSLVRAEIERMRVQVGRQRREILQLQRAGINSLPAEALLSRMLARIDLLCAERDRLKRELSAASKGEPRKPKKSSQTENAEPPSAPVRSER
jgi:hypothetical protein